MGRGLLVGLLAVAGCFNGKDALGLPCDNDRQCGDGQSCVQGVCGGPGETTTTVGVDTSTSATGTEVTSSPTTQGFGSGSSTGGTPSTESEGTTGGSMLCPQPTFGACVGDPQASITFDEVEILFPQGRNPMTVVAGDFYDDEGLEIATVHYLTGDIAIFGWNSDVSDFELLASSEDVLMLPMDMAAGDIDCDGLTDLAIIDEQQLTVLRGAIDPFLSSPIQRVLPDAPLSVTIGELLGQGPAEPEIVVAAGGADNGGNPDGSLYWAGWDPDDQTVQEGGITTLPSFSPWDVQIVAGSEGENSRVLVADSDESNLTGEDDDRLLVYEPNANGLAMAGALGQFSNPYAIAPFAPEPDKPRRLAIVEKRINVPPENTDQMGELTLCQHDQPGMLDCERPNLPAPVGAGALAVGDFDCDQIDDLVVGGSGTGTSGEGGVWVYWGGSAYDQAEMIGTGVSTGHRMAVADFDGDGDPDIAVPDFGAPDGSEPSRVVVYLARPG